MQSLLLSFVILIGCQQQKKENLLTRRSPIQEPYEYISGGSLKGANVPESPDPLVRYVWDNPKATDLYKVGVVAEILSDFRHASPKGRSDGE